MGSNIGIVFPGQGSQSLKMSAALADSFPVVKQTYEQASDVLGLNLWQLVQEGPQEKLNETHNTQPAMLTADIAVYRVWLEQGGPVGDLMAGHSLGEYSALVAAGAMGFEQAVALVAQRGAFMQQAVPEGKGAMAAILGLDDDVVIELCREQAQNQVLEAVNFNSPGQVVIAGERKAVERGVEAAKAQGARRALMLPVSVPSHCALMQPAAEQLAQTLADVVIELPKIPVLHNVDVQVAETADSIKIRLTEQLYCPVRWVETIQKMKSLGMDILIESGPGKVLAGLNRRIDKTLPTLPVFDPASLETALEKIHE